MKTTKTMIYYRVYGKQKYYIYREYPDNISGGVFYTLWNNGNYLGNSESDTALINVINDCVKLIDKPNENRVLTK